MSERKVILNHSSEFETIEQIKSYFKQTEYVGDALVSLHPDTEGIYAYKGYGEIISLGVQGAQGAQGKDGTGVNVKASKDECVEAGDAYIDNDGNILIYNGKDAYTNGGKVMGPQGWTGERGYQGEKGEEGVQGAQGINGVQGAQGDKGVQGSQGINGVQGAQGDLGVQGHQGVIGLQGSQGIEGVQGEKGIPGEMGYQGEKGDKGAGINIKPSKDDCKVDGDAYIKQDTGEILILYITWDEMGVQSNRTWVPAGKILGPQGVPGVQGPQGVQGDMGIQGNQGVVGLQGIQGSQGITGVQGDNGIQGAQGVQGDKGNDGKGIDIKANELACEKAGDAYIDENGDLQIYDGEKFNNGGKIRGPQGREGERGHQGVQGSQGITGIQGTQGSVGLQGSQGAQGDKGDPGTDGDDGITPIMGIRFDEDINRSYFTVSYDGKTTQDICPASYRISPKQPTVETLEAGSNAGVQSFLEIDNSAMTQTISFHFRIPKGDPGTGINIKANADACTEAGDAYIDDDGHIQILESIVDNNKVFNDGGQIKGPQGAQGINGEQGLSGEPGTKIVGVQGNIIENSHERPYASVDVEAYDVQDNEMKINFDFYNITGKPGNPGADGGVWIPSVDENGNLSWSYSETSGTTPGSINIAGDSGASINNVTVGIQGGHSENPECLVNQSSNEAGDIDVHLEFIGIQGAPGEPGASGATGGVWIPSVEDGNLSWSYSETSGTTPGSTNIKGDAGASINNVTVGIQGGHSENPECKVNLESTIYGDIDVHLEFIGIQGAPGEPGASGATGGIWIPSVEDGNLSWSYSETSGTTPGSIHIKGDAASIAITTDINGATSTGIPTVSFEEEIGSTPSARQYKLTLKNLKGEDGAPGKSGTISAITATVDSSTADELAGKSPVCIVEQTNDDALNPAFHLSFSGICGKAATLQIAEATILEDDKGTRIEIISAGTENAREYELQFFNIKGQSGNTVSITGNLDNAVNTGTPTASFTTGDTPYDYVLTLENLKGAKGDKGDSVEISPLSAGNQGFLLVVNETDGALSGLTVNSVRNIYAKDGSIWAEQGFYEYSDETLKYFMNDIPVDFEKIKALPKKYYIWKNRETPTEIGTSAQKVQQIYPELVTTSPDGHLTVNYGKLSIVALKAIDMLYDRINYLESEIEKLKK